MFELVSYSSVAMGTFGTEYDDVEKRSSKDESRKQLSMPMHLFSQRKPTDSESKRKGLRLMGIVK